MKLEGITAHPDDVTVTVGSQQGLDLVTRLFCDPGDVVLCEAPSYVGALGVFRAYQCEVVHVAMDEHGLDPVALAEAVAALQAAGKKAKFLYTIPNFHNPAGVSQTLERRDPRSSRSPSRPTCWWWRTTRTGCSGSTATRSRRCARWTPSGWSTWGRSPRPSRPASGSAGCSPRTRSGRSWCWPRSRRRSARRPSPSSPWPRTCSKHDWRGQIKVFREMYRERRDAMLAGLADHMPAGTSWTVPQRRLLRLADPAPGAGLARHAAAGGHRPGGVRARHRLLRRRLRQSAPAPVLLLPDARADHRGHPPTGRGDAVRGRRAGHLRHRRSTAPARAATGCTTRPERTSRERPDPEAPERPSSHSSQPAHRAETVVVLSGGLSHERDVSLRSGRRVALALRSRGIEVVESDVDSSLVPLLARCRSAVVFPVLHGEAGEDGALREVLALLGRAVRRLDRLGLPGRLRQVHRHHGGRRGRASPPRPRSRCRTRSSASSGRRR